MLVFLAQPSVYWMLVLTALAALAASFAAGLASGYRPGLRRWSSDSVFLCVAAIAFLAMRWPTLFGADPYIDEAQMIAQAVTAEHHPVPWRSFDGTTSGPLNTYALILPRLLGISVSLFSARLVASALVIIVIGAIFFGVRAIYGSPLARVASAPPLFLFGLGETTDLTGYSSEILPIALLTVALALAAGIATSPKVSRWSIIAAGICCGAAPFAKLQASVLAGATALVCLLALFPHSKPRRQLAVAAASFTAAAVAPAFVILAIVAASGSFRDFVISYLAQNFNSMTGRSATLETAFSFPEYRLYFTDTAWAVAAAFIAWVVVDARAGAEQSVRGQIGRLGPAITLLLLLVSGYTVEAPHREYPHYFLFAVVPVLLFAITLVGATRQRTVSSSWRLAMNSMGIVYAAVLAFQLYVFSTAGRAAYLSTVPGGIAEAPDPVAQQIARIDPPRGRVAIWGYAPYLYVKSGTMMGTRDSLAQFSLTPGPYQEYYRRRFLFDLEHNKPALFVDACAPGQFNFTERAKFGYETFPQLAAYINANYTLIGEVKGVRIFRERSAHG